MHTSEAGLSHHEAERRLKAVGANALPAASHFTVLILLARQFKNPLIFTLLFAVAITLLIADWVNFAVISGAVILNAGIGFFQDFKANRALAELKRVIDHRTRVIRGGVETIVSSAALAPGDLIELRAGERVPADARIMADRECRADESGLTGEWLPVAKTSHVLKANAVALGDLRNLLFMGTVVAEGSVRAIVYATGGATELGKIARVVKEVGETETPLQEQVRRLGRVLGSMVVVAALAVVLLGVGRGEGIASMVLTAAAIAVAAIPEGLPAAMSVALAVSTRRILASRGLVRQLVAAETLGAAAVICTDKTGTLTEGTMRLKQTVTFDEHHPRRSHQVLLRLMALAIEVTADQKSGEVLGSPTDKALFQAAQEKKVDIAGQEKSYPLLARLPFASRRQFQATFRQNDNGRVIACVIGAPERLLSRADYLERDSEVRLLRDHRAIQRELDALTGQGWRVVACAWREMASAADLEKASDAQLEALVTKLTFVGLVALEDPLRPSARAAIQEAKRAGIRSVVVTGDHQRTAESLARALGLSVTPRSVISGAALLKLSDQQLAARIDQVNVFARVSPEDKLRIIDAWHARGAVVAMTGDGINDAPALKRADIGIAMGSGKDVAREVADLVLLNDNFATIIAAVRQGRIAFDNMRKVIVYLLANSLSEVVLVAGSLLANLPVALLPAQILWNNLVTDGLPNFAFAFEPGEKDVMRHPPRPRQTQILDAAHRRLLFMVSALSSLILFSVYYGLVNQEVFSVTVSRSLIFAGLGFISLLSVFAIKSLRRPLWQINILSNRFLLMAAGVGLGMILVSLYVPFFNFILNTAPLGLQEWGIIMGVGLVEIVLIEIGKGFIFKRRAPCHD